jgi:arylsulfatase A-like enzyme
MGDFSALRFFIERPRDLRVRLSGRNFRFEGAPRQTVEVEVNGHRINRLVFETQVDTDQQIRIPKATLVEGFNELVLRYAYSRRPKKVVPGSNDYRQLAMQWDSLEFVNLRDFGRPEIRLDTVREELVLPRHSRVDYFLRIKPGTILTLGQVSSWGEGQSLALEVALREAGTENEKVVRLDYPFGGGDSVSFPLETTKTEIVRLSLRTVSNDGPEPKAAGLRLMNPRLEKIDSKTEEPAVSNPTTGRAETRDREGWPNVVLYIIDTLRADHLGCYGYRKPTSPHIDAFAADATRFARVSAQSAWTKPSIASILTGLYPPVHGANSVSDVLSGEVTTLAEALGASGYVTAAFVTNSVLSREYGFDQGYDHFEYLKEKGGREFHQLSDVVNQSVFSWLDDRPTEKPFFVCVHTMDPHAPYTPRSPYEEKFAGMVQDPRVGLLRSVNALTWKNRAPTEGTARDLMALYDGEIAFNDSQFGKFVDRLKALDLYESSVIVLVADHGEEFRDHGRWQHGFSLFQEMLHVPLVMRFPEGRGAGEVIRRRVAQVDIMPTVLEAAGLTPSPVIQGKSLVSSICSTGEEPAPVPVFSFIREQRWRDVAAITVLGQKLVWYRNYDSPRPQVELYDLDDDPEEEHNLAKTRPILAGYLKSLLKEVDLSWAGKAPAERSVMSEEMEERLRALGYLQ